MRVPFLDLSRQHLTIRQDLERETLAVLESQRFILGPQVEALEARLASLCGVGHGVGVASGTDALMLALQAGGVGPGDEVLTSPFTFFATGSAVARLGARPVFADIDAATFNLDAGSVAARATRATRVVVPVHLFGQCADVESIAEAVRAGSGREPQVIEDAAQAIGAKRRGRAAGSLGQAGCLSFYPTKNLGGAGDGGMVVTSDPDLAARVRSLRAHGDAGRYDHRELGMNSRLDALQAAVLLVKAARLESWNGERRRIAAGYAGRLGALASRECIRLPAQAPGNEHTWHQYVIRTPRRDDLASHLERAGVGSAIYYPTPLHLQPCFSYLGHREGDFPEAERACREVLALPIYPGLTGQEQDQVAGAIEEFFRGA